MRKFLGVIFCCCGLTVAESPLVTLDGVGIRSLGMANNYTAVANDYSAIFWNPAGLSFIPIREVHAGFGGSSQSMESELNGMTTDYKRSVFQFNSAGLVRSIPTSRGGLTFAMGYSAPYSFSECAKYSGTDVYLNTKEALGVSGVDTIFAGDTLWYDNVKYYASGNLGMWSGAAGWQVAEHLGFGVTASFLYGKQLSHKSILSHTRKGTFDDGADIASNVTYTGFDLRFGGLYQVNNFVSIGARLEIPQVVRYNGTLTYESASEKIKGQLRSSFAGGLGGAITLPFAIISVDGTFRAPNADVDSGNLSYWKVGSGIGVEVPVEPMNAMFRCGYTWKEFDQYPYAEYVDDTLVVNTSDAVDSDGAVHLITAGATFVLSKSVILDLAYANTRYSSELVAYDWMNTVKKTSSKHRGAVSIAIRY